MGFSRFDVADYLSTPEDVEAYLNAVLEDGNAREIALAVGTIARAKGMSSVARDTGLNRVSLYTSLSDEGNPSLDTIVRVLDALGYELQARRRHPSMA